MTYTLERVAGTTPKKPKAIVRDADGITPEEAARHLVRRLEEELAIGTQVVRPLNGERPWVVASISDRNDELYRLTPEPTKRGQAVTGIIVEPRNKEAKDYLSDLLK